MFLLVYVTFISFITGGPSFGLYSIEKKITIPGYIIIFLVFSVIIFGIVKVIKYLKNRREGGLK